MASVSMRLYRRLFVIAALFFLLPGVEVCSGQVGRDAILVSPDELSNGSPFLLTISLDEETAAVTGTWQEHPVMFFSGANHRKWFAVVGIDVEVKPGSYPLTVEIRSKDGDTQTLHKDLAVEEAAYTKVPLTVPDKFVEPDAAAQKKIAADKVVKDKAFANTAATPQWTGNFTPPLHLAPESDSFGNQRLFNGTLASVHRGLDYHAKPNTPVLAINSGRVATGPHLHLGVRWEGSYLDPAKLFLIAMPQVRTTTAAKR